MKREEVINQLKELIEDRKSFMIGECDDCYDKDVQSLEYAIRELERTAQEVPVQEQLCNVYPTCIEIKIPIESFNKSDNTIYHSSNAVMLKVVIDSNLYSSKDVIKGIKEAYQRVLECFH